jgi:uncharacterized membrane protein YfcA
VNIIQTVLFGLVIMFSHFVEGITGFGCTVLALPFGISLVGIKTAVPTLVVIGWIIALYIVIIDFKNIIWKEYFKMVSVVIFGLPIGMWLFSNLSDVFLKKLLGIFMIVISTRGIILAFREKKLEIYPAENAKFFSKKTSDKFLYNVILFCGGIIHGAFSSGGPFIVIYATVALPDKSNFRATLCALWLTLNLILIVKNINQGVMSISIIKLVLCLLPFLIVGMVLGNIAHNRIKKDLFIKIVYAILFISGIFMFID